MVEMSLIGRITGFSIEPNKDGDNPVLMLQIELTEPTDIQTAELMRHTGVDYNPPPDSQAIVIPVTESLKIAVATDDGILPESLPGEYEIYSSSAKVKLAKVKCDVTGKLTADSGPAGNTEITAGVEAKVTAPTVDINNGTFGAARVNDTVLADASTDSAFFAWVAAVSAALVITPPPVILTSKITLGSATVKIGG